jgi:uncharacterized membrane protein
MRTFAIGSLLLAVLTVGLMAGVYAAFAFAVMPGLARTADRTFVEAMQRINVAILNGWFLVCFLGGLVLSALALVLSVRAFPAGAPERSAVLWIVAGLVLYAVTLAITFVVNVPLNNALLSAGSPEAMGNAGAVRAAFEPRWVAFNIARAVVCTVGFACLAWALHVAGSGT